MIKILIYYYFTKVLAVNMNYNHVDNNMCLVQNIINVAINRVRNRT